MDHLTKNKGAPMTQAALQADLHVHSKYSKRPSVWMLRKIGASESYTEPVTLYRIAKAGGMDLVTITDHNTVAGSLEIAHLPDTFISEEVTTYFPDDGCKLHVLVYGISERRHADIAALRANVFDLACYLRGNNIVHALAHPLYAVNDRLTLENFERLLVLFNTFEQNGTRDHYQNRTLSILLDRLTPEIIDRLANQYDIEPFGNTPWKKNLIGGSDDHASINMASRFTRVSGAGSIDTFLSGIDRGLAHPAGRSSDPKTMAHNLYAIAYQFYNTQVNIRLFSGNDLLLLFVDKALSPRYPGAPESMDTALQNRLVDPTTAFSEYDVKNLLMVFQKEGRELIVQDPRFYALITDKTMDAENIKNTWFLFLNKIAEKILKDSADTIFKNLTRMNLFSIFHSIGSMGTLYVMLSFYFMAYTLFTKDRRFCKKCEECLLVPESGKPRGRKIKMAHFTDTFHEINGVARTLQDMTGLARKLNKSLTMITCGAVSLTDGVKNFDPIGTFELPEYSEIKLHYPPPLQIIDYCYEEEFTHIHTATPGPMGLAALAIARILGLPLYGTYHTSLPQYVKQLTNDDSMAEYAWKYMKWYYSQMDVVFVPSKETGEELIAHGIPADKIRFYTRGIDIDLYHPSKNNGFFKTAFPLPSGSLKLLYVGRVSREKNMPALVEIFKKISAHVNTIHLVIVGEGPYLDRMRIDLEGYPAVFTGYITGEALAGIYASSDIFIFPSTTDTFGNVILEAQASGIPALVTDIGGPKENVLHDRTGFIIPSTDMDGFVQAAVSLAKDPAKLLRMKGEARKYMENRSVENAFLDLWERYRDLTPETA